MCGIVGYITTSDIVSGNVKDKFLTDALILDTFRGFDSTGLLTLSEDFDIYTYKDVLMGWDFVRTEEFHEAELGWAAIGHNRAATRGEVNWDNAHPFNVGPVHLVHNGTLSNMGRNLPNFCQEQKVDSVNIARALAHVPPEEASEVLSHIDGAFALVWLDERDHSVNITRNSRRPLHFSYNAAKNSLWYMSDANHLNLMRSRKWCYTCDLGDIYQFETNKLFKFTKGSIVPEVTTYAPFARVVYQYPENQYSAWTDAMGTARKQSPSSKESSNSTSGIPSGKANIKGAYDEDRQLRIWINGEHVKAPEPLLEDLDQVCDIDPNDKLIFRPERWEAYANEPGFGMAIGKCWVDIWSAECPVVVHHVPQKWADRVTHDAWWVRGYGVTDQISCGKYTFGIMAKVVGFHVSASDIMDHESGKGADYEEDDKEDDSTPAMLIGPMGRLYSLSEWLHFTRHGCGLCSATFAPSDHDSIWWTGELEQDPICNDCVDEYAGSEKRKKEMLH